MTAALLATLLLLAADSTRTDLYGDPLPPGAVACLGTIRMRHAGADVAFSANGKQLISCGCDETARFWDVATGKLLRCQRLTPGPHQFAAFQMMVLSPGGRSVAAWDGMWVYLFDTATGNERGRIHAVNPEDVLLPTFSLDGRFLAVRKTDDEDRHAFQVWDVAGNKKRCALRIPDLLFMPLGVVFTPDGKRLVGIGRGEKESRYIFLWDTATGEVINQRGDAAAEGCGEALAISPDGKTLAVEWGEGRVGLLDALTLKDKSIWKAPTDLNDCDIGPLVFSPDGRWLAGEYRGIDKRGVLLWDVAKGEERQRLPRPLANPDKPMIRRLAFAPDSKTLAHHDECSSEIRLWDVASGRLRHRRVGHDTLVPALAVSPDGKTIASGDVFGKLRLWEARTGEPLQMLPMTGGQIRFCSFSPYGKRVVAANTNGTVEVWDAATGAAVRRFEIDWTPRWSVEFHALRISADGKRLAAVASGAEDTHPAQLLVWDMATGEKRMQRPYQLEEAVMRGFLLRVSDSKAHAAFSPDGERVSTWLGKKVGIEEIATGSLLATLPADVVGPLEFSPDSRLVAASILQPKDDPPVRYDVKGFVLIEAATGQEIFRRDIEGLCGFAFAPDHRALIVADETHLHVWDATTGERLHRLKWSENTQDTFSQINAGSLAVLPGGRAATGMTEGDILIWDLAPLTWPAGKPARDLDRKELEALWADLIADARTAYGAMHTLAAAPGQSVPYLNDRLKTISLDGKRVEKLLADLDGDSFEAREAASRELSRRRYRIEPMLRRVMEGKPSLEMRRRLQAILAEPKKPPADALRTLHAIAVLERIGTPEARRVLKKLAGGADVRETREAKASLERLRRSPN